MAPKVKISVAIYNNAVFFKHWSLFVEGPKDEDQYIYHIHGSSPRFSFEMRASDANASTTLSEIVLLCEIPADEAARLGEVAQNQEIHNDIPAFNCQDWILDLLSALEEEKIIDGDDEVYKRNKLRLEGKQEGLN